jgi:hypothetical protein
LAARVVLSSPDTTPNRRGRTRPVRLRVRESRP